MSILPLSVGVAISTYLLIDGVVNTLIGLTAVVVFGFTLANIAFVVNRNLEDTQVRASGTNVLRTTRNVLVAQATFKNE